MGRSLALAGVALAAGLAVTGCRAEKEPTGRDVEVVQHRTGKVASIRAHHGSAHDGGRDGRTEPSSIRDDVIRDILAPPGRRHRPTGDGCSTVHPTGQNRGVEVRCARRSGDDIDRTQDDRSHHTVTGGDTGPDDDASESD